VLAGAREKRMKDRLIEQGDIYRRTGTIKAGSHNLSLVAFGGDSFVELLSAALALRSFGPKESLTQAQTDHL